MTTCARFGNLGECHQPDECPDPICKLFLAARAEQERQRDRALDEQFEENHQRCMHCGTYTDLCRCDGGL